MIFQHWENKLSHPLPETGLVLVAAEGRVGRCRKGGSRGCAQASCPTYMMASGSLFLPLVGGHAATGATAKQRESKCRGDHFWREL